MKRRNIWILCCVTLIFVYCIAAMGVQSLPVQATSIVTQDSRQPPQPDTPQPGAKTAVFTGTIVKQGSDFVLRDTSGTIYNLDAPDRAQPYEDKSVQVTGTLEATSNLLHVKAIQAISA
jgi:hypothetical protein